MLNTSSDFLAAILSMSRTDRITGTLTRTDGTVIDLTDANIEDGSVSISWECVTGEEIEFGSAIMAELDFDLRTEESRYVFYGAKVQLTYGVKLQDGSWLDIPLGVFTVAEAERKNTLVELTAYDNLLDMDDDYGGTALYGTPFEIMTAVCEHCGLRLSTTEEEFLSMPNGEEKIQIDETSGCNTWRDCAKVVAQMVGAFIIADRTGAVALRRYGKQVAMTIPKKNRYKTTMADYICRYMGLRVVSSKGEFRAYDVNQEEGLELTISDAPAWDYGIEETLQARVDTLLQEVIQIIYTPGSTTIISNPALECGDLVDLETDDGIVTTLITSMTWKYRGKMTIDSAGVNPYLKNQVTRKTVILRELQTQTTENKLIFYSFTNNAEVNVSGSEAEQVSQVTFVTVKATSAMFIAQLPVVVDCQDTVTTDKNEVTKTVTAKTATGEAAQPVDSLGNPLTLTVVDTDTIKTVTHGFVDIQVEYYLEGTLVDYELIQRFHAGHHILSLFYAFDSLDGNETLVWQVKIRVVGGSGTVTVPKKGFRATITGQGLAGTDKWDGTLTFDETVAPIEMGNMLRFVPMTTEVTTRTQKPIPRELSDTVPRLSMMGGGLILSTMETELSVAPTVEQQTIAPTIDPVTEQVPDWVYNVRFVGIGENGLQLKTAWSYQSEEQIIDSGHMTVVKAVTSDLVSVEEVTVSG